MQLDEFPYAGRLGGGSLLMYWEMLAAVCIAQHSIMLRRARGSWQLQQRHKFATQQSPDQYGGES